MSNSQQQVNAMYQAFVDRNDPEKALSEWYNNVKQNQHHKTSIGLKMDRATNNQNYITNE